MLYSKYSNDKKRWCFSLGEYCSSCGMPLKSETRGVNTLYCKYCTDKKGTLYPREKIQEGIAQWLSQWALEKEGVDFMERALCYMKAMPTWSD